MARMRYLKPGFFSNELLAQCSPWARLLFAGLWLLADREGRLEDRPVKIHGEIFPYERDLDVEALLAELASQGFIVRYVVERRSLIAIPTFSQHQSPHPKEPASRFPEPSEAAVELHGSAAEINGSTSQDLRDLQDLHKQQQQQQPRELAAAADCEGVEREGRQRPSTTAPREDGELTTPPGEARKPTTLPGEAHDPATATREMQPDGAEELVAAIAVRGLSRTMARSLVRSKDPGLIREVLGYYDRRMISDPFRNPPGALRRLLEAPNNWGFEETEAGWRRPKDPAPAGKKNETEEEKRARVKREREARDAERAKIKPPTEEEMAALRKKIKGQA